MQFGIDVHGQRVQAERGVRAHCPICQARLIAKCGSIKVHHWAHESDQDCDPWWEGETEWHRGWKSHFPTDQVEVVMGEHRADIVSRNGVVIELQHSPISPAEIEQRERFYRRMVWVVDASEFASRLYLLRAMDPARNIFSIKWKHMKASWSAARSPVYFDLGPLCLRDILGARKTSYKTMQQLDEPLETLANTSLIRYREGHYGGGVLHESLAELDSSVVESRLLCVNTLYASGHGSVIALNRERFRERAGATPPEIGPES